jgi:hypothetical protein
MDKLPIDHNDPMRLAAYKSLDAIHGLSVKLHYATCESGVAKDMKMPEC